MAYTFSPKTVSEVEHVLKSKNVELVTEIVTIMKHLLLKYPKHTKNFINIDTNDIKKIKIDRSLIANGLTIAGLKKSTQYKTVKCIAGSGSGTSFGSKKVKTSWQELGAAYIFEQALVKNVKYSADPRYAGAKSLPENILLDMFRDDLPKLRVLFQVPKDVDGFPYTAWLNSFYFSQKVLLDKYSSSKFQRFERDGGFMAYISALIKRKFNISKKDTWNPADIWAIRGSEESIKDLIDGKMKKIKDYKDVASVRSGAALDRYIRAGTLYLNSILIDLLTSNNPKVVGISLKMTGGGAHIEEVNFAKVSRNIKMNTQLIDTISDPFEVSTKKDFYCNFAISKRKSSNGTFTQDIKISAKGVDDESSSTDIYNFQIKANSSESAKGSNLKFELSIAGMGAARGGKVPVDILTVLVNKIKNGAFVNDYTQYPRTKEQFEQNLTDGKRYKHMFSKLKDNIADMGVDYDGFVENVTSAFDAGGAIASNATCKLMGFEFLYFLLTIKREEMLSIITDMAFLAQKKNIKSYDTFGPFIKIS